MRKYPQLICTRYVFHFSEGWEVKWYPHNPSNKKEGFNVIITHHHESGGDSTSYTYPAPPSAKSSLHLIKMAIKEKSLPKQ